MDHARDLVGGGHAFRDQPARILGQRDHAASPSQAAQRRDGRSTDDFLTHGVIDREDLENADAPTEAIDACVAVLVIAPSARAADAPQEPLGDHAGEPPGNEEGRHTHVEQSGDRAWRIDGVEARHHEVTCDGRGHRDLGGLAVTDFSHHDDIGILA